MSNAVLSKSTLQNLSCIMQAWMHVLGGGGGLGGAGRGIISICTYKVGYYTVYYNIKIIINNYVYLNFNDIIVN